MTYQELRQKYKEYLEEFRHNKNGLAVIQPERPLTFAQFAPNVLPRKHKKEEI